MGNDMNTGLLEQFCTAVNAVKRTGYSGDTVNEGSYLGGDLGIDSIEMLEIWFRLEKALEIQIPDQDKRDIYTVGEVLATLSRHQHRSSAVAAG